MKATPGIPTLALYDEMLRSKGFREMELFSDAFVASHGELLAPYAKRWARDPLHQWSRQWEYPYTFGCLAAALGEDRRAEARVLDAGSGATFFPYYVQSRLGVREVHCVDIDRGLEPIFRALVSHRTADVRFTPAAMNALPFDDGYFDAIYCVSVLEHTDNYPAVVAELARVLAPGGSLIVTFDISVDGDRDVSPEGAVALLRELGRAFPGMPSPARLDVDSDAILTTTEAARWNAALLPWKSPLKATLSTLRRGRLPKRWGYPKLTCYCQAFTKH